MKQQHKNIFNKTTAQLSLQQNNCTTVSSTKQPHNSVLDKQMWKSILFKHKWIQPKLYEKHVYNLHN